MPQTAAIVTTPAPSSVTATPKPPPAAPRIVTPQYGSYTLTASNAVQYAFLALFKAVSRKIWIFPGVSQTGGGPLSQNAANISIGIKGDGPAVTPMTLSPNAQPILVELPVEENEVMAVADLIVYGTSGDGITIMYWV